MKFCVSISDAATDKGFTMCVKAQNKEEAEEIGRKEIADHNKECKEVHEYMSNLKVFKCWKSKGCKALEV